MGLVSILLVISQGTVDAADNTNIGSLLTARKYGARTVGVAVAKLGTESTLVAHNADKPFIPASVTKLVTGAAAYELLGQEYRFTTQVYLEGGCGDSGIVRGDLYIRGGGDPGFLAERLWLFVQHLYHRGIRRVEGDLVLDDTFFDTCVVGPGFSGDGSSRAYVAPIGALSASFNTVAVHQRPGARVGAPVAVDVFPEIMGIDLVCTAKTTPPGRSAGVSVRTEHRDKETMVAVYGSMALGADPRYTYRKVWNPAKNFAGALLAQLKRYGVEVKGDTRHAAVPDSIATEGPFYTFKSHELSEFVRHMFKYSSNFAAEMIYKTIAAESNGDKGGSWDSAQAHVRRWWKERNLPGKLRLVNGSGMGTGNHLTPAQLVALLQYVWKQKTYYPDYCAALSNAGVDGTLKSRFTRSSLKGKIRAKTGTLNDSGVSSLAGYVFDDDQTYVFAILVNNTKRGQFNHWTLQQKILETVVE